jgi:hypothetical protein
MTDTLLKILVVIVILFILYLSFQTSRVKEGLTNPNTGSVISSTSSSSSSSSSSSPTGLAGNAAAYASIINNKVTQLSDALLISKYSSDYVNVVDAMQNYLNALSLELILSLDASDFSSNKVASVAKIAETLNIFSNAQTSLNNVLTFINANS